MNAGDVTPEGRVIAGSHDGVPIEWQADGHIRSYVETLESSLERERAASRERSARLVRECASAHRRGVREGVLLAAFVVVCCGVVLAVFLAAWLNGGSGGAS